LGEVLLGERTPVLAIQFDTKG